MREKFLTNNESAVENKEKNESERPKPAAKDSEFSSEDAAKLSQRRQEDQGNTEAEL